MVVSGQTRVIESVIALPGQTSSAVSGCWSLEPSR
jgi:hypothetical protein